MIKKLSLFFFQILITIIILDVIFLLFLPNKIKNISIFYLADENKHLTKGFPKNYFENNNERGFDIKRSVILLKHNYQMKYKNLTISLVIQLVVSIMKTKQMKMQLFT